MGVGKSTVGPRLAERLGLRFIDTDHEVERTERRTIAEIFDRDGEVRFRQLEAEAIESAAKNDAVIALGGGAMAQPGAAKRILELGRVVYLEAPVAVLLERIGDPSSRPLLAGLDRAGQLARLEALCIERAASYRRATVTVDASGSAKNIVDLIVVALEEKS